MEVEREAEVAADKVEALDRILHSYVVVPCRLWVVSVVANAEEEVLITNSNGFPW